MLGSGDMKLIKMLPLPLRSWESKRSCRNSEDLYPPLGEVLWWKLVWLHAKGAFKSKCGARTVPGSRCSESCTEELGCGWGLLLPRILLHYSLAFSLEPRSTLLESGVSPSHCFQRINLWEDVNSGGGKLEVHVQTLPDFKPLTCSSAPYFFPTDCIPRDSQGLSLLGLCERGTSARWPYSLVQACRFSFPSSTQLLIPQLLTASMKQEKVSFLVS